MAGSKEPTKVYYRYWAKAVCWDPSVTKKYFGVVISRTEEYTQNRDMSIAAVQRQAEVILQRLLDKHCDSPEVSSSPASELCNLELSLKTMRPSKDLSQER